MITMYKIPEDLSLSEKLKIMIRIKCLSEDYWCERFTDAGKVIRSNISFDSFLEFFSDHHPIEFFLVRDFEKEMFYGKAIIKFDISDAYYKYNIDLSLCDFMTIVRELKLVEA